MKDWVAVIAILLSFVTGGLGLWFGRRRGRKEGASIVTSAAAAKARELELELMSLEAGAAQRVADKIETVRAEARAALADDSPEAIEALVQEARKLRKELGI